MSPRRRPALPAKLTRPDAAGTAAREALLARVRTALEMHPGVWIAAPAGAGKTTLLAQLATREPCLWYQWDVLDDDPERLFQFLAMAAGELVEGRAPSLPRFVSERLADVGGFATRFFIALFERLPSGTLVVFDDVHAAAGPESAVVLRAALDAVPEHVRLVVASRQRPPPELARHLVNRRLALLDGGDLSLSVEETRAMLASLLGDCDDETASRVHARARGWAAATLLLARELPRPNGAATQEPDDGARELLFSYLAAELWSGLDEETRSLLLRGALPARLTPSLAAALTGARDCGARLERLHEEQRLTHRRPGRDPVYELHPLFREFLLERGRAELSAEERRALRRRAAAHLEQHGDLEQAAELLIEGADHDALQDVLSRCGGALEKQRRWSLLARWIGALPDEVREREPRLSYWLGVSLLPHDTVRARAAFEVALAGARKERARTLAYLAWARGVESILVEYGTFQELDRWLEELPVLREELGTSLSLEVFGRVSVTLFDARVHRQPDHDDVRALEPRLRRLLLFASDLNTRVLLGAILLRYYAWAGHLERARSLLARLRAQATSDEVEPLVRTIWAAMESIYAWYLGSPEEGVRATHVALAVADQAGVKGYAFRILVQGTYSALAQGDLLHADALLARMPETFQPERRLDIGQQLFVLAWAALARGDVEGGLSQMREALEVAREVGVPYVEARALHGLAQACFRAGRFPEAREHLEAMARTPGAGSFPVLRYIRLLSEAELAFAEEREHEGKRALEDAFTLGEAQGYQTVPHFTPAQLASLAARAFTLGVRPVYARALVQLHRLFALVDDDVPGWPWPVEVRLLGRFELRRGGERVDERTASGKPVELLKALACLGGRGVHEHALTEALWPDADGDRARDALKTTLSRLRKLIGADHLEVVDRRVSLRDGVFVDALALERELERLSALPALDDAESSLRRVSALYRGPLLVQDDEGGWLLGARGRVASRYLRVVERGGRQLEEEGRHQAALEAYSAGLDREPASEALHQGVIRCCFALGRDADGMAAFERCRVDLERTLGLEPSAETRSLLRAER